MPRIASAALGGDEASIAADSNAMRGTLAAKPMQAYEVQEIAGPHGGVVREYADRRGRVFAVAWQGNRMPDLAQLLGTYYDRYLAAASLHRSGHHLVVLRAPDLVVSVVRYQRSAFGHAYLPGRVPAGVLPAELR
ncbi:MAG: DUF2844 domain-containing protein [Gammaproteobacteria bacterium]|nr:DUF2844 domain-containing protein [Gammaproteobacteria bacterium]MDE2305690.1 DUF2844 domain-containing protein [Gammaproteobacteria bacterium]